MARQTLNPVVSNHDTTSQSRISTLMVQGLRRTGLAAACLVMSACATSIPGLNLVKLPEVDSAKAVSLNVISQHNSSATLHHHILRVDGSRIAKYEESDRDTLLLTPGKHLLSISCHSRYTPPDGEATFPYNYRVSDGDASVEIEAYEGESLCLSIGYKLLDCAILEVVDNSECR